MSVYTRPDSPFFWAEFQIESVRFRISTEIPAQQRNRRQAELKAERLKLDHKSKLERQRAEQAKWGNKEPPTLGYCVSRYWEEVGKFHVASDTTWTSMEWLVNHFGTDTLLPDIESNAISLMIAKRRGIRIHRDKESGQIVEKPSEDVKNATVNRYATEPLRKLFRRAREVWGYQLQYPVWSDLMLAEPQERVREASVDEEERMIAALGPDYGRLIRFMIATGLRSAGALLTWPQIDLVSRTARIRNKSRDGQERWYMIPLSTAAVAILQDCRGDHETWVFTYVAKRTVHEKGRKVKERKPILEKGKRYPITDNGFKSEWRRNVRDTGIAPGFRRHDTRHTTGTRFLRATGNLKGAQKLLGHSRIDTTVRYAHVLMDDLRAGLEQVSPATGTKVDSGVGDFVGTSRPNKT